MNFAVQHMDKSGLSEFSLEGFTDGIKIDMSALGHLLGNCSKLTKFSLKKMQGIDEESLGSLVYISE